MGRKRGRPTTFVDPVIGERIKAACKKTKITQERLAEMLDNGIDEYGFQQRTISNWVCGDTKPSDFVLHQIAEICNVQYSWLSNQEGQVKRIIDQSRNILESLTPEYMEKQHKLVNLLWRLGYDLAVLEIDNSNFVPYIKRHIDGRKDNEVEAAIKECMVDYELLKAGFKK